MALRTLMVCVGNICRSPMAEALWNQKLKALGGAAHARSAGLAAHWGQAIDPVAERLLAERKIDASDMRSKPLRSQMLRDFELVLVMEQWQKTRLEHVAPFARGRIYTLGHWGGFEVPDPYGESEAVFRASLKLIDTGVSAWLKRLRMLPD